LSILYHQKFNRLRPLIFEKANPDFMLKLRYFGYPYTAFLTNIHKNQHHKTKMATFLINCLNPFNQFFTYSLKNTSTFQEYHHQSYKQRNHLPSRSCSIQIYVLYVLITSQIMPMTTSVDTTGRGMQCPSSKVYGKTVVYSKINWSTSLSLKMHNRTRQY
jgi:hypothetical protein